MQPGRVAESVGHLTRKSGVLDSIPGLATYGTFVSLSAFSRRAAVSYWRKYVHEVLVKVVICGKYINLNKITKI